MKSATTWAILLGLVLGPIATLSAEELPVDMPFRPSSKERKISSMDLIRDFEAPAEDDYRFGEGDRISIDVWDHPELSVEQIVGPDGHITLPVAGPVHVQGLPRDEVAGQISSELGRFYLDLAVTVRVEEYASNRVYILGRVSSPGVLKFDTPPTLLEAITRAGGLPIGGIGADKAALTRCAVFRGREKVAWIDLRSLLTEGNLSWNIRLQRDDVIYIPDADDQLVYVLGEVKSPGAVQLSPNMSFLEALAVAGGGTEHASNTKIHLVRPSAGVKVEISLKELLSPHAELNVSLEEGDIVYIPRRNLAKLGYFFQQISPAGSLLVLGAALGR